MAGCSQAADLVGRPLPLRAFQTRRRCATSSSCRSRSAPAVIRTPPCTLVTTGYLPRARRRRFCSHYTAQARSPWFRYPSGTFVFVPHGTPRVGETEAGLCLRRVALTVVYAYHAVASEGDSDDISYGPLAPASALQ